MGEISAFLGEQMHGDSRLSFGYDVANAYKANDESYIWLARRLAQKAHALLLSTDPGDTIAVSQINCNYSQSTHTAISERLENKLDTPLTPQPLYWLQSATTRDIALFTIANRELHHEHQAALTRDQPAISEVILEGVEALIAASYYPKEAMPLYRKTLKYYGEWKALDAFESGGKMLGGYCTAQTVALANTYTNPSSFTGISRFMQRAAVHELAHGVDFHNGRGLTFQPDSSSRYEYFLFLCEAMAEHDTVVHEAAWSGRNDILETHIIEPAKRNGFARDQRVYLDERTLCGVLELDPVQLAETQLSSINTRRGRRLRADILAQMNKSFGSTQNTFIFARTYSDTPMHERGRYVNRTMDILLKKSEPFSPVITNPGYHFVA